MLANLLALLALWAAVPSTQAYESNEGLVPSFAQKFAYCGTIGLSSSAGPDTTFANSTPPYSLVVYNATLVVDDKGIHFDKVPLKAKSGIDPIETVVLSDAKVNETLKMFSFIWVVDVPYGNYILTDMIDSTSKIISNFTLMPFWVSKGTGTCNQSTLNLQYDPSSMSSGALGLVVTSSAAMGVAALVGLGLLL